jgi:hypothetical protein
MCNFKTGSFEHGQPSFLFLGIQYYRKALSPLQHQKKGEISEAKIHGTIAIS